MRTVSRPCSFTRPIVNRPAYRAVKGSCTTAGGSAGAPGRWSRGLDAASAARAVVPPARADQPGANGPPSDQAAAVRTATAAAPAASGRRLAPRPAGARSLTARSRPTSPTLPAYSAAAQIVRVSLPVPSPWSVAAP